MLAEPELRAAGPSADEGTELSAHRQGSAERFVWAVWAFMSVFPLLLVWQFSVDIPMWDQFDIMPQLTGAEPVTVGWLLQPHNEHCIALPKAILVLLMRWTGDFRAASYLNAAIQAAACLLLLRSVKRLRGSLMFTDCVLPILLVGLSHWQTYIFGFQLQFVCSVFLSCVILSAVLSASDGAVSLRSAIASGIALMLLPLCGANGAIVAAPAVVWHLAATFANRRQKWAASRITIGVLISSAALTAVGVVMSAVLILGTRISNHPPPTSWNEVLRTIAQYLTLSLGKAADSFNLPNLNHWPVLFPVVLLVLLTAAIVSGLHWHQRPDLRLQIEGVGLLLLGNVLLAVAIGWGRAGRGDLAGWEDRYSSLAAMIPLTVYLLAVACRFDGSHPLKLAIFFFHCAFISLNMYAGLFASNHFYTVTKPVAEELRRGESIEKVAWESWQLLYPGTSEKHVRVGLRLLKQAKLGPFRDFESPDPQVKP